MDWSKGMAVHRLYGHKSFAIEAHKAGRNQLFISTICTNLKCDRKPTDWRQHLEF